MQRRAGHTWIDVQCLQVRETLRIVLTPNSISLWSAALFHLMVQRVRLMIIFKGNEAANNLPFLKILMTSTRQNQVKHWTTSKSQQEKWECHLKVVIFQMWTPIITEKMRMVHNWHKLLKIWKWVRIYRMIYKSSRHIKKNIWVMVTFGNIVLKEITNSG